MTKCELNLGKKAGRKPKWVVMAEKLNPVEYIEWLHKTMAYKHTKRKNYSKTFNSYSKLKVCKRLRSYE